MSTVEFNLFKQPYEVATMLKKTLLTLALSLNLAVCYADEPNKDFFRGTFASASPMGNVVVANDATPIFDFFKKRAVEWEKIDDNQWVVRIKNKDPLTGNNNETAIMFVREMSSGYEKNSSFLVMSRAVTNGKEVSPSEVYSLAMQIYIMERPPGMPKTKP